MSWLSNFVHDPYRISIFCVVYIVGYYLVSFLSIRAVKTRDSEGWWRKDGPLDVITSITWLVFAALLIWSLGTLAFNPSLTLRYLILYYFFFIFLFAFWYGILAWHFNDMFVDVTEDSWRALLEHILISVQTQTTIGYTRGRPKRLLPEVITCLQALLGIFMLTISVARAVNKEY